MNQAPVSWPSFSAGCLLGLIVGVGFVGIAAVLVQHLAWH